MNELAILKEKRFWKAALINTTFIIIFLTATFGYMFLFKQTTQKMQQTEFMKLTLQNAEDVLKHNNEIIATTPVINKIYAEWTIETLAYAIIIATAFAFFHGNTLSVLHNNKWLNKKEFKQFLGFSFKFFALAFAVLVGLILFTKTKAIQFTLISATIIFYLLSLAMSAATIIHKTTFIKTLAKNSVLKILPRTIISMLVTIILMTITGYLSTAILKQPKIALATNTALIIIWTTWMAQTSLKCTNTHK
ncbi:hypothetical protein HY485_01180 [Candidatus Woesearchaeota archaeon]|nr:hypothetical protein [Candidatus Woesearchaeota archaeon]